MNHFKEISIELTKQCTLKCIYCSSDASNARIDQDQHLNLIRLEEIIEEVKTKYNIDTISLSGGESLLYRGFDEFFEFLKHLNLKIKIYTCGVIFNAKKQIKPISQDRLKRFRISDKNPEIHVNIQGYDKQTIEGINRISGSYENIMQTIANVKKENIFLGAHVVPFKKNYQNLEKIYTFCHDNGFNQISFLRFVPQGRGKKDEYNLNPSEFCSIQRSLIKILEKAKDEKIVVRLGHPINFLFLLKKGGLDSVEGNHCCRGGIDAPLILPDGAIAMCPAWKELKDFSPGNIYRSNFSDIWTSKKFNLFRQFVESDYKRLDSPCKECQFLNECKGKCVAQRLLFILNSGRKPTNEDINTSAPDPSCFRYLVAKEEE